MDLGRRIVRKVGRVFTAPGDPGIWRRALFRVCPSRLIFLKQYGERRTGTNFLRAILLANHPTAYPVMHVLGDKHAPPVALETILAETRNLPSADLEFVTRATIAASATTTATEEAEQQLYLQKLARPLAEAVRTARLGFIISTKHAYPWAASMARYRKWMREVEGRPQMLPEYAGELEKACHDFNLRHRAWLDLHDQNPARCAIIRHEDLLEKPEEIVARLERQFGLWRLHRRLRIPQKAVAPTTWDQNAPWLDEKPFDRALYTSRHYEDQLSPELWSIVTKTIDWDLMARFGYEKTPLVTAAS